MNNREAYESWLEKCRHVEFSGEFTHSVMKQVSLHEQQLRTAKPGLEMSQRWLEWMAHHPLVRVALLVVALIAGAVRLLATWQIILSF
jgi:type VI protein secretion system component VasK